MSLTMNLNHRGHREHGTMTLHLSRGEAKVTKKIHASGAAFVPFCSLPTFMASEVQFPVFVSERPAS